jgi:hypothetical protein
VGALDVAEVMGYLARTDVVAALGLADRVLAMLSDSRTRAANACVPRAHS